jgi:ATPase subunit of ABC transporter with duplicated ATPase domains
VKQLEKIDVMQQRHEANKPTMSFKYKRPSTSVTVKASELEIGYTFSLLKKPLNFELREGEKAIVRGYNGIGKTTFLKTLASELKPFKGKVEIGNGVKFAFFHQSEAFNELSPVEYLKNQHPQLLDSEIRAIIGKFGVKSQLMNNKINTLSGGEQTKVRLASLSLEPASLLILDEPTNHLDVLSKEALLEAIQKFTGTVLLTTHDTNFETN